MVDFPFTERKLEETVYERTFKDDLFDSDLLWHWDEEDREVTVLHETDWLFQFDNMLPQPMTGEIKIPKGVWHRVIKGNGDLIIKVKKNI